jgi:hypothetical protein
MVKTEGGSVGSEGSCLIGNNEDEDDDVMDDEVSRMMLSEIQIEIAYRTVGSRVYYSSCKYTVQIRHCRPTVDSTRSTNTRHVLVETRIENFNFVILHSTKHVFTVMFIRYDRTE